MRCPAISIGFLSFVFPFDATKPNFRGGFTDLLEVLASCCGGEVGAIGAGVGVEPVCHFGLVFCGDVLISEDIGYLALLTVVAAWDGALAGLRGTTWDAKGIPKESMLVGDGAGGACNMRPQ